MSAITSRMPIGTSRRFARLKLVNGVLAALLAGVGVSAYLVVTQTQTAAPTVRTAAVGKGVVLSTVSATGALQSPSQIAVGFPSAGTLVSVTAKPGQNVRQGQVLGRIDATSAQQALRQAEASLASAQAQYQTTLTGETPQQRKQDALAVTQAQQSVSQAKSALSVAQQTASTDGKSSAAAVAQAERQLAVDQGQLKVDVAKRDKDRTPYATADAASAAVTADKVQLVADQNAQQADQQAQLDAQAQQSRDQASLTDAKAANDASQVATYNNALAQDQGLLSFLQKKLAADSYAITQDNSKLSADQAYLTALQNDDQAIRSDELKITQDNNAIANAKRSATATAQKDAQSIAAARKQISSAQLSVQSVLAANAVKQSPPTPSALAGAKANVVQAQVAVENANKALQQTTLRAPIAGVVASVSGAVGTQVAGSGNSVAAASSSSSSSSASASSASGSTSGFVTLTKLSGMQIVASFSETDASKLRVGQPSTVTVDALPSRQLAAHVIAVAATASTSSSNVVTYSVIFGLDRTSSKLKPGMTANVDVVTGEQDNVLHVPTAAVNGSGSNATVTVLRNGTQQRVPVAVGLKGDSSTAILSGLRATDSVVLPSVVISSSSSGPGGGAAGGAGLGGAGGARGGAGFGGGGARPGG
jgi:macrolide-specific efflux system membrane fusion protein